MREIRQLRFCLERSRLLDEVAAASRAYSESAIKVAKCEEPHDTAAYLDLLSNLIETRVMAEAARENLKLHKREHGCDQSKGIPGFE